jgi:hypothetical protein
MKNRNPLIRLFTTVLCISAFILLPFHPAFCQSIGVIGTATYIGDWTTDVDMNQDPSDPNHWTLNMTLSDGEVKFRQDNSWAINWGGTTFPTGTGVPNGSNIPVTAGNYAVSFNTGTLIYRFVLLAEGNTGIGTFSPQERLDVNGNIRFSGELKPEGLSGAEGQVLQSTGDGSMEWAGRSAMQGSVGFGTWGDCNMLNLSEYNPVCDPDGEAHEHFGWSVGISGDFTLVGTPSDNEGSLYALGSVSVFYRDPSTGKWRLDGTELYNPGAATNDNFGLAVDLSGEYGIIGCPGDDFFGSNFGSAIIIKRDEGTGLWDYQTPKLWNPDGQVGDNFGISVSISGEYAIVGAPYDEGTEGINQGSASIFKRNPGNGNWELQGSKILDPDPGYNDQFGYSVSISGDYAIIGAHNDDGPAGDGQGSASIYKRNESTGIWEIQGSKIYSSDPGVYDYFGWSVSIDGDYAIVGAKGDDGDAGTGQGSAEIIKRDTTTGLWAVHGPKLWNEDADANQQFGYSVAISEDFALVGTPGENGVRGSATLFVNIGPVWHRYQKITDPGGNVFDNFGSSCDLDNETGRFVVGAFGAYNYMGTAMFGKY